MQSGGTFREEIKRQYQYGGTHIRLIIVNIAAFLVISLLYFIARVSQSPELAGFTDSVFSMERMPADFIYKPWGLVTSIFAHFSLIHLVMNMLFLYFFGQMFLMFFSGRRLVLVYILGGIFGNLLELLLSVIPAFSGAGTIVGASGAIMAVTAAVAFYRPKMQVNLFGVFPMPVFVFAIILFVVDFIKLGSDDHVAHAAHLGGALLGMMSVTNLHSSRNLVNFFDRLVQNISSGLGRVYKPGNRLKVEKGGRTRKSDEQYNVEAKERQHNIDRILDKISKSGYDSLTKAEKEFLFSQSKK